VRGQESVFRFQVSGETAACGRMDRKMRNERPTTNVQRRTSKCGLLFVGRWELAVERWALNLVSQIRFQEFIVEAFLPDT